jgi:hypothetical protein
MLSRPDIADADVSWMGTPARIIGVSVAALLPLGLVALGVRGAWRWTRRRRLRARRRFASGEAAATAIPLSGEAEIDGCVGRRRCPCGTPYQPGSPADDQRVRYDGRILIARAVACPECARRTSIFFSIGDAT